MRQWAMNADWPDSGLFFARRIDLTILHSTMQDLPLSLLPSSSDSYTLLAIYFQVIHSTCPNNFNTFQPTHSSMYPTWSLCLFRLSYLCVASHSPIYWTSSSIQAYIINFNQPATHHMPILISWPQDTMWLSYQTQLLFLISGQGDRSDLLRSNNRQTIKVLLQSFAHFIFHTIYFTLHV